MSIDSSSEEKKRLRAWLRQHRLPSDRRNQESEKLCGILAASALWHDSASVAGYMPLTWETDVKSLLSLALNQGKHLTLPRIEGSEMRFHEVASLDDMVVSAWGIREPAPDRPQLTEPELMIVPLEAADRSGFRLGKGGGYYDRYLSAHPGIHTVAMPLTSQLLDDIPHDYWDVPIEWIVTPTGLIQADRL